MNYLTSKKQEIKDKADAITLRKAIKEYKKTGKGFIIWDGNNTNEVIDFCIRKDNNLCPCHDVFKNLLTGVLTLQIEPADVIRQCSLYIPVNSKVGYFDNHWFAVNEDWNRIDC